MHLKLFKDVIYARNYVCGQTNIKIPLLVIHCYYGFTSKVVCMFFTFLQFAINSGEVMAMEDLPINDGAGQSYGYTLYQTTFANSARSLEIRGLRDYGQVR